MNRQTWPLQAQYRLHIKLQLWLIMQSKILNWAMPAYSADCFSDSAFVRMVLNSIRAMQWWDSGTRTFPSLPHLSSQQDSKLAELFSILKIYTGTSKLYILRKKKWGGRNKIILRNLTRINPERFSHLFFLSTKKNLNVSAFWLWQIISNLNNMYVFKHFLKFKQ